MKGMTVREYNIKFDRNKMEKEYRNVLQIHGNKNFFQWISGTLYNQIRWNRFILSYVNTFKTLFDTKLI